MRTPSSRRIAFEMLLRAAMNGWKTFENNSSGRATRRATGSAFWIE